METEVCAAIFINASLLEVSTHSGNFMYLYVTLLIGQQIWAALERFMTLHEAVSSPSRGLTGEGRWLLVFPEPWG